MKICYRPFIVRNVTLTESFACSTVELLNVSLISEGNEQENLSLCIIKSLAMKACEGVKVYRKAFLTSTRDESGQFQITTVFLKTEKAHPPAASTAQDTVCTPCSVRILWRRAKFSCSRQHSYGDPPVALLHFHQSYVGSLAHRGKCRLLIGKLRFPQRRRCCLLC